MSIQKFSQNPTKNNTRERGGQQGKTVKSPERNRMCPDQGEYQLGLPHESEEENDEKNKKQEKTPEDGRLC